ncbi:methyltransferase domain-containing protein [Actinotalea sp. M2MS4P-6]|uniref:methyltransferase domain-containing protein n=1 Tax=Actinotalea sp. M2MS4P-6 TaxID=2983762 RepID=UPI0029624BBD|nr:methyltransferase domain-containing protein [Actinotalea sp. M2MS4P-6]
MTYTHGHAESVLRSHRARTAADSAAYLLPELRPGQRLLDVGCGPGTITLDLARAVAPGEVVGVDASDAVLAEARLLADAAGDVPGLSFRAADAMALPFPDASFDVVHAHQVLQHLPDPVRALREMRRVVRPGGLVAVRDVDYATMTWAPASEGLAEWRELYREVANADGGEPDAGRYLAGWALQAGFASEDLTSSASAWAYAGAEATWWAQVWADRATRSDFAQHARDHGLADDVLLEEISEGWLDWGAQPDAWFGMLHGELLARVPG